MKHLNRWAMVWWGILLSLTVILAPFASIFLGQGATALADTGPAILWSHTFGVGNSSNAGHSVRETADGGYIIAGTAYYTTGGTTSADWWNAAYLVKTDASGNLTWQKTFGNTGSNSWDNEAAYSVEQTTDGGYVIAGYKEGLNAAQTDTWDNVLLIKTDASGNLTWKQTYGGLTVDGKGYAVQQTADGGYIIAGTTYSETASTYLTWLIKTDVSGNVTWQQTFPGYDSGANSLQQAADGGYIIAGSTASQATYSSDVYLIKTDASGSLTWSKTFSAASNSNSYAYSVQQTGDSGYIIAGWTDMGTGMMGQGNGYLYLVKTDASGNLNWSKTFGTTSSGWMGGNPLLNRGSGGNSVQQTTDGGYIFAGTSYDIHNTAADGAALLKTDASGNLIWQVVIGGSGSSGSSVQQTTDGGYVMCGSQGSNVYLVSVSGAPGAPTNVTATAGNAQATVSFSPPSTNGGSAITSYTVTSSPGNITASSASSPITVTGLTDGTSYTFTVTATNAMGTGPASSPSNLVTPTNITLPGDVNGDGKVDAADLTEVAAAFGSTPGSPRWNTSADLNHDGIVNIFDLVIVGLNYGRHV